MLLSMDARNRFILIRMQQWNPQEKTAGDDGIVVVSDSVARDSEYLLFLSFVGKLN